MFFYSFFAFPLLFSSPLPSLPALCIPSCLSLCPPFHPHFLLSFSVLTPSFHPSHSLFSPSFPLGSVATSVSICLWRGWWDATWPVGGASRRQRRRGLSSWRELWHPWTRVETEMHCYSNTTPPSAFHSDSTTTHMRETRWNHCNSGRCVWFLCM